MDKIKIIVFLNKIWREYMTYIKGRSKSNKLSGIWKPDNFHHVSSFKPNIESESKYSQN